MVTGIPRGHLPEEKHIAMEMNPQATKAQKMDAMFSQVSSNGYEAVIVTAERIDKICPMMTPARIFLTM